MRGLVKTGKSKGEKKPNNLCGTLGLNINLRCLVIMIKPLKSKVFLMARINIDSLFFSDSRIQYLTELIEKNLYETRGRLITLWSYCYENRKYVLNKDELEMQFCVQNAVEVLVKTMLVEEVENGYKIKGVEHRIKYLIENAEKCSKAGLVSAERRKSKYGTSQPLSSQNDDALLHRTEPEPVPNQTFANAEPNFNPLTLSLKKEENPIVPYEGTDPVFESKKTQEKNNHDHLKIFEVYNTNRGRLPEAKSVNKKRERLMRARWKENPNAEFWEMVCVGLSADDWYCGHNDRGWVANLDFVLQAGKADQLAEKFQHKNENEMASVIDKLSSYN